ncbi:hypothetical protein RND71_042349 [Anisodus tanguticus]|uniref:Uncharacterized protein n=1 Tax=Anisodus tanguticus TaxID=243964 RepID=A0AAE1QTI4_9SOLA|nr:hypothetical protein RND71_042349 [Anisodus tanguticus]
MATSPNKQETYQHNTAMLASVRVLCIYNLCRTVYRIVAIDVRSRRICGANDLITIFPAPECFNLCSYLLSGYTRIAFFEA